MNRKNDEHTISNKSLGTIKVLFDQGYNDALDGFKEYIESKEEQPTESMEDGRM